MRSAWGVRKIAAVAALLAALPVGRATAVTNSFYVNASNAAAAYPYTSWAAAATNIQDAIDAAADGDVVWVTNGVYSAGGAAVHNGFLNRVALNKGIVVRSVNGPGVTVIAGQGPNGPAAVRCAYVGTNAALIGFTLTDGATRTTGSMQEMSGGGVWCEPAGVASNCVVTGNSASFGGGGAGGGAYRGCRIERNVADSYGGGVFNSVLYGCSVSSNAANFDGGGVYAGSATNCVIMANSALGSGGGVASATITGCAIVGNRALTGAGFYSGGVVSNCTIVGNTAMQNAGGVLSGARVANSIVYGNRAPVDANVASSSTSVLYRSCSWPVAGNAGITNDPQLVSAWHIAASSPCAGTGAAGTGLDLDNEPWRATAKAIGCDEPWPAACTGALSATLVADYPAVGVGFPVTLTLQADGMVSSNRWTFGDGRSCGNQAFASVAWPAPGTYTVTATVFNATYPAGVPASVSVRVDAPGVRYVSATNTNPVHPYTGWSTAATNIQDAIDAGVEGDTVLVGDGVYAGGGRVVYGLTRNRLAVTRPMTVRSVNGPGATIVVGGGTRGAYLGAGALLAGFTFTNCSTAAAGSTTFDQSGGGAWCDSGSTISNCVVAGCVANMYGGGIYGGAAYGCRVTGNQAQYGGGLSGVQARNCVVKGNAALYSGGGVYNASAGLSVVNCAIVGNIAGGTGSGTGGGLYGGLARNCVIAFNQAKSYGGVTGASGCYPVLINSIVYYNTATTDPNYRSGLYSDISGQLPYTKMTNTCTTPTSPYGVNCIALDPQLVTIWKLAGASPCIGAGLAGSAVGTDLDGDSWLNPPSIGADEYTSGSTTGALAVAVAADRTNAIVGQTVSFTGDVQGAPTDINWNFGDGGATANTLRATHAWNVAGTFTVVLRANNLDHPGGVSASMDIVVTDPFTRYVNAANPTPQPPYTNWAMAATSIQDAVDACLDGDIVLVTNGIYNTGGRVSPYSGAALTNRVCVTRAVAIRSVNGAAATVIQGAGETNGPGAIRGVYLGPLATIEGFTVTGGRTYLSGSYDIYGGGIFCDTAGTPTVRSCIVTGNRGNWAGGVYGGLIHSCRILTNDCATGYGGGSYSAKLYNSLVAGNTASRGGGDYNSELRNCTVVKNAATSTSASGGGTYRSAHWNTIVYGNTGLESPNVGSPTTLVASWTNNPVFIDFTAGDYRLGASPCIDAGSDLSADGVTNDLDGLSRPLDGNGDGTAAYDIGCYEFNPDGAAIPAVPQAQSAIVPNGAPSTLRPSWLGGMGYSNVVQIVSTNSAHGLVTVTNNVFTYTPATNNYEGAASFTWRVRYNGTGTTINATYTLTLKSGSTNDWPQWRYDEHRSAQAPIFLPPKLRLQWRRDFPTVPGSYTMYPDLEYCRPVQLGKRIFVPIGASDSVAAYDTDTGTNLWTYYASGAIRRPPLAVALTNGTNLVVVGSEDGNVYALNAVNGVLCWKFRAAPNAKKAMGFGRLGSIWPVCMSPVESQGRIYFGAGFMPSWMLYVYCVDAASGTEIWRSDGGLLEQGQNSGIGPLTVSADHTKVYGASGKQNAWMLDRASGKFLGHAGYGTCSFYVDGNGVAPFSSYRYTDAYKSRTPSETIAMTVGDRTFTSSTMASLGVVGTVSSLLAGDGKLFATTTQGSLYCFGSATPATTNIFAYAPAVLPATNDVWTAVTTAMLSRDDLRQGLALVWGVGSGRLVEELAKQAPGLMVVACDPDPAKLRAIRVKMDAVGWSGARVSTVEGNPMDCGFAPFQAALIASEDVTVAGYSNGAAFVSALYACTRPFGGEIWLPTSNARHAAIAGWLDAAGLPTCGGTTGFSVARQTGFSGLGADGFTQISRLGLPDAGVAMKPPFRPIAFGEQYAKNALSMNLDYSVPVTGARKAKGTSVAAPAGSWDIYTWLPLNAATPGYQPAAPTNVSGGSVSMPATFTNALYDTVESAPGFSIYGDCGFSTRWGSLKMNPGKQAAIYQASQDYWGVWYMGDRGGCSWSTVKILAMAANGVMNLTGGHSGCGCGTARGMQATQVAVVPEDEGETWLAYRYSRSLAALQDQPVKRVGINFGGVGDRYVPEQRMLWTHYPYAGRDVASEAPPLIPVVTRGPARSVYRHSAQMTPTSNRDRDWVAASQVVGMTGMTVHIASPLVAAAAAAAPAIDGALADACWADGGRTELSVQSTRDKFVEPVCSNRAYAMVRYDATNLYVAGVLTASMKPYGQYWPARYVSVGCATRTNLNVKALFSCTSSGNGGYPDTLGAWQCAYTESTNGFVGEMAIPWDTLAAAGIASNQLVMNVGVCGSTLNGPTLWEGGTGWNGSTNWSYALYYRLGPAFYFSTLYFDAPTGVVATASSHLVRLHFAEMEDKTNNQRVFDVSLQGTKVLTGLDVAAEAGGGRRALTKTFYNVPIADKLDIDFTPVAGEPMLSGVEIIDTSSNLAPQLASGPTAWPNPCATGAVVAFTVEAADLNGDALAYAWTFGDGGSAGGTNVTHAYAAPGVHTARVTVSDGSLATTGTVFVAVLGDFDAWRLRNFGSTNGVGTGALEDYDCDGMSNVAEWLAGTDPLSAASRLEISGLGVQDSGGAGLTNIVLRWSSATGRWYAVDASTNLLQGFPFTIFTNLPATPAVNTATIQVDQADQQFFRIRLE